MADETKVSFEDALARLEQMVDELESGRLTLDESLARYEAGVSALRQCYEILRDAEGRVERLIQNADGTLGTAPFEAEAPDEDAGEDNEDDEDEEDDADEIP